MNLWLNEISGTSNFLLQSKPIKDFFWSRLQASQCIETRQIANFVCKSSRAFGKIRGPGPFLPPCGQRKWNIRPFPLIYLSIISNCTSALLFNPLFMSQYVRYTPPDLSTLNLEMFPHAFLYARLKDKFTDSSLAGYLFSIVPCIARCVCSSALTWSRKKEKVNFLKRVSMSRFKVLNSPQIIRYSRNGNNRGYHLILADISTGVSQDVCRGAARTI